MFVFVSQFAVVEANNVRIRGDVRVLSKDVSNPGNVADISFAVEWDNSWRDKFNYDGVYIFLKYKLNEKDEQWHHLYLMNEGHKLSDGFALDLKNSTDSLNRNEGFFIYRDKINREAGTSLVNINAKWLITSNPNKPLRRSDFIDGKVLMVAMGIEMVYVPRAAFRLGDTYAANRFSNNYFPMSEKHDVINSQCIISSSSPLLPEYPDPKLAVNRVNDLSDVKSRKSGFPTNSWYGDKNDIQYWAVEFPKDLSVKYLAIESVPGYVPDVWKFEGQANTDVDNWEELHKGTAADWETSLERIYPTTNAFRVNKSNKNYRAYRIRVEQKDMSGGVAGNPPLLKSVSMTTTDLSKIVDHSVLINTFPTDLGGRRGLSAKDGGEWSDTLNVDYPNGYEAFWTMKYEISQEQYVTFLNKLTANQQRSRTHPQIELFKEGAYVFGSNRNMPSCRNGICLQKVSRNNEPMIFGVIGADVGPTLACNYLSSGDMLAYADWCGLRPLSEMEYEKMCRAYYPTKSVRGEYPWNTLSYQKLTNLNDARGTRTEAPINGAENVNIERAVEGPIRVGAFATNAENRAQTGVSFWGVMDWAGNLAEICYNGNMEGRKFKGIQPSQHGNGKIRNNGEADVSVFYWPQDKDAFALKGGSWADTDASVIMISDRSRNIFYPMALDRRDSTVSFRLGHTAKQQTFPMYLTLQNGSSTETGVVADTTCHSDSYYIRGSMPEELKEESYIVAWYASENLGETWDMIESEGDQDLVLTKLWNINTDTNVIQEYWFRKEIYGLQGDAVSEKVIVRVLNTSTYLNSVHDTLDIYNHSQGIKVDVTHDAEMQWIVNGSQQNMEYVIQEKERELVAPPYNSLKGVDTWYLLRTVFQERCVSLDTIYTHRLPTPVENRSDLVNCGDIMIDMRDRKRYPTVKVGSQCWMTENLNFYVLNSRCYDDIVANCDNYGRLYNWKEAVGDWNNESQKGICPDGWHIPNNNEWIALGQALGASGQGLRSQLNDWKFQNEETLATNQSRFSALPGGGYFFSYTPSQGRTGYYDLRDKGWWWSSEYTYGSYSSISSTSDWAKSNIPAYYTVDYLNDRTVATTGANSIFYGHVSYLGGHSVVNATSKGNAKTAMENNFYFNVRCVKDE